MYLNAATRTLGLGWIALAATVIGCSGNKSDDKPATVVVTPPIASQSVSKVIALGRVEPEGKIVGLAAEVAGIVQRVNAAEGAEVAARQIVIELQHGVQTAQLRQAIDKLNTQRAQVEVDRAQQARAQVQLDFLRKQYERTSALVRQGAETAQQLDQATTDLRQQEQEVERARLAVLTNERRITEIDAERQVAEAQLEQRLVRAPSAGRILKLDAVVGAGVDPKTSFAEFAPAGRVTALCEVDELFADRIKIGQQVVVRPEGRPDTLAVGSVSFAAPYLKRKSLFAERTGDAEDRRVREVRVVLTGGEQLLFNSRVECVIIIEPSK